MAESAINLLLDPEECRIETEDCQKLPLLDLFKLIGNLGYHAMMLEVHLTPKPGLVDVHSTGAHSDMDLNTFVASANAIHPFLPKFVYAGWQHSSQPAHSLLSVLRPVGIAAEAAMFAATNGINTHKGMIFSLGLVCGAVGWLRGKHIAFDAMHISQTIKQCCEHLVLDELRNLPSSDLQSNSQSNSQSCPQSNSPSYGEMIYLKYGLTGARGEAASGLATVTELALPAYQQAIGQKHSTEQALWQTLLVLMASNPDTNLVSRGGLEGLHYVQQEAQSLLDNGGCQNPDIEQALVALDQRLIERNLSPGGSADLLAITWLIAQLNELDNKQQAEFRE